MQRLRVRFYREKELKFISHLDIMRLWQRAFIRSRLPLAYSEGFSPHPRISLAAPLPIGVTSQAELMDVYLNKLLSPHYFTDAVSQKLPPGIGILKVQTVNPNEPSLQSIVRQAEYEVSLETEKEKTQIEASLGNLLKKENLPWQHLRDTGPRNYDLRALIDDLWFIELTIPYCTIGMRLRCGSAGSGRPEQVSQALGFSQYPNLIHRTKLILKAS